MRTSAMRLPPTVCGAGDEGFLKVIVKTARKKKESAYVGDGANRWPSVYRLDAARLFRLALEKGSLGGTYHEATEEGIPFEEMAEMIGRR
jgi:nucleoside-diphosphate-sugar epimerase